MEGTTIRLLDRTWSEPRGDCEGAIRTVWHPWPQEFTQGWLRVHVEEGCADDRILLEPEASADRALVVGLGTVRAEPAHESLTLVRDVRGSSLRARVAFALHHRTRVTAEITPVSA